MLYEPKLILPDSFDFNSETMATDEGILEAAVVDFGDGRRIKPLFISGERVMQEVGRNLARGYPFFAKPTMIVTTMITTWIATIAIRWLATQDYFDSVAPTPYRIPRHLKAKLAFPPHFEIDGGNEAFTKGYLEGAVAEFPGGLRFPTSFINPVRLKQDTESSALMGMPFFAEPGLIAVDEITRENCILAAETLGAQGYFEHLKPLAPK